ncbi:Platelet-activating factor acetylhydrolase, plasma/intracellular isoform II, partial [Clostridiales bacterium oral taxon 876 str. F0540]
MRLFEMLLLLLNVVFSAENLLIKKRLPKWALMLTSIVSMAILAIHLLVEGYRLQLIFLYCVTVLVFIYAIFNYYKTPVPGKASHAKRVLGNTFIIASLLVTAGLMYIFPVFTLPNPTGTFKIGTEVLHLVDQQRTETLDKSAKGKRELMVQVWYPAENTSGSPIPFIPDTQILGPMAENYGLPGFIFQYLKYVLSHSYKDANISSAKNSYPLIIINHGFGSSRFIHTSQAEDLASHGYIVVAIDHTYNTFATIFPDGRMTTCKTNEFFSSNDDYQTTRSNRDKIGKVLTDDVTFVMNELQLINSGQIQSSLKGRIDLAHIGIFGHSIGGATAYDSSYDSRITAGIDLDGGLYRLDGRAGSNKPFLFIDSEDQFKNIKMVM